VPFTSAASVTDRRCAEPNTRAGARGGAHAHHDLGARLGRSVERDPHGIENAGLRLFQRGIRQAVIREGANAPRGARRPAALLPLKNHKVKVKRGAALSPFRHDERD
jgi:hypothetical protein